MIRKEPCRVYMHHIHCDDCGREMRANGKIELPIDGQEFTQSMNVYFCDSCQKKQESPYIYPAVDFEEIKVES